MLASMLAQTPRTPPSVPTSVASTIMTQLPQERLPKNLEKKLVHTPYTATSANGISTSSQAFSLSLVTAPIQRDIVTSDSRGHMMQQPSQINVHSGLKTAYSQQQQQQGFLDKILSGSDDNILIAKSLSLGFSNNNPSAQSSTFAQLSQATTENSVTASLADILNDPVLVDVDAIADSMQPNQASDPQDAQILEEICSLREDHNVETRRGADDRAAILKLLGEVSETTEANIITRPVTVATTQDINEKIAISAIQKELMEGSSAAIASRSLALQNSTVVSSQAGRTGTQISGTPVVQAQLTSEQVLLLQQQQQLMAGSLPPNYSLVTNRVRLPVTTQASLSSNQELLAQAQRRGLLVRNTYIGIGNANVNQIRKTMKTRLYLQQAQKRALEQKQQLALQTQQPLDVINSPATAASFPENMNDLLNNTVAPNVTLLRSSGIPEVPGSARFNLTLSNPLPSPTNQTSPTPAQLSPGQRYNPRSPFSPLSQQPFPSQTPPPASYQTAQVSPHPPPSYPQGGPSHSPSPIPPSGSPHVVVSPQPSAGSPQWSQRITTSPIQNLQLQNPMLNAQLSQASLGSTQVRLTSQQRQQLVMRSMSSPAPNQSTRTTAFSSQSDVNYTPLSPVMLLQTQASQQQQQQRVQRARIASGSQSQSNFASSEPVLSPRPLSSPSFSQPGVTTATFVSISSPGGPLTYSVAQGGQQFTFERQNAQVFTSSPGDSIRSSATVQNASELLRQELRSSLAPRNQQVLLSSSSSNQQVLQSLSSGSVTRVLNVQSLSRETLEELGLSIDLLSDGQSTSQSLYSHTLLNIPNSLESSSQPVVTSPRAQVEEPKPADQKKSLLQQLLSEPT
ncbi:probable LIM domain-containing serine/threonine-protein kinase DDB_G0286997 isoform X2 [Stegodyphus dumicola]|uniref:probable LIM domain-containing serine/threonine-protein kinase DDB_G0286997 isoform X2 n=1 Tax=Stegodyphus dumicola TaxID=202533 RepID=UPI0015B25252|nr:probable LIM domain-containing serine/threonine-protein kinase DDB_G0286997 isoform X2 [Stegodyphus dumicola]